MRDITAAARRCMQQQDCQQQQRLLLLLPLCQQPLWQHQDLSQRYKHDTLVYLSGPRVHQPISGFPPP
jgi:hypothetical protein